MHAKLTLSVDPRVIEAAKAYASERGTSVSQLVESFLTAITAPSEAKDETPQLTRWRGFLAGSDVAEVDHRAHLAKKYGL
jgi:hypothetical protein